MRKIFKKLLICILLEFLIILTCFSFPSRQVFAKNITDNAVIILSGNVIDEHTITIKANLTVNTGINAMTLELVYDNTAMLLSDVVFGEALSSLEPITTNTNTNKGFAITPFKFNYLGDKNDFTTGNLFTMTFKINENVTNGNYKVSIKYTKNKDVTYYDEDNNVQTKNLYIDNTEIAIKNNSVVKISSVKDTEKVTKIWIVICYVCGVVIVVSLTVFVISLKKRRNWKRL